MFYVNFVNEAAEGRYIFSSKKKDQAEVRYYLFWQKVTLIFFS